VKELCANLNTKKANEVFDGLIFNVLATTIIIGVDVTPASRASGAVLRIFNPKKPSAACILGIPPVLPYFPKSKIHD
jgi:hypothetical protein